MVPDLTYFITQDTNVAHMQGVLYQGSVSCALCFKCSQGSHEQTLKFDRSLHRDANMPRRMLDWYIMLLLIWLGHLQACSRVVYVGCFGMNKTTGCLWYIYICLQPRIVDCIGGF